ncbi:replication initiator protein A [Lacticaseibacillus paracasei]|uniref:replication initiator protein A n=1 Tax=Lacticaseibacillus paracasei TaxID=1597 RepID=UPI0040452857
MSHPFNFIHSRSAYNKRYFQFPQILLYGQKYSTLSDAAKIAYMVLQDRLNYSLENNWVDEHDQVFFIFTNQELKDLLHWSNSKVQRVKKELADYNLLFQKTMHFNPKTGKNEPNRLYLAELDVSAIDVYQKHAKLLEPRESLKISSSQESFVSLEPHESLKIGPSQKQGFKSLPDLEPRESLKIGRNLDKDLDITSRDNKETEKLDFSTNQYSPDLLRKQNQDLVQNAKDYLPETANGGLFLNKEGVELLGLWCRSPKQMHRFLGIILNAKKAVEREHEGTTIVLDDPQCQEMINKTMRRFFNILRSDSKKINNVENYLFGAMKETLVAYWNKSLMTANGGNPNEF